MTENVQEPLEAAAIGAPLVAEAVELEYAGPRMQGLGRAGRDVVAPLTVLLPPRCWKTGISSIEAQDLGVHLVEVKRTIVWSPWWVFALAVAGLFAFFPALVVGVVLYFVYRRKVRVCYTIRRDILWQRRFLSYGLAIASLVTVAALCVAAFRNNQLWLLVPGIGGGIVLAILAAVSGRIIGVRKVVNNWAHLTGAGRTFLEREAFDFAVT